MKSYGDLTLTDIVNKYEEIAGEWNGDESGKLEDRANKAKEMLDACNTVLTLVMELDGAL